MIKVKGLQVPPAEIEDLLLTHPDVEDCAVLGIKDEYSGEKPKAFVVLKKGVVEDVAQGRKLLKWVKDNKVRYKWLAAVEFVKEVPKSPTGKLLRRVLKVKEQKGEGRGLQVWEEKARL
jgi:4-coumarate--CoA ligase